MSTIDTSTDLACTRCGAAGMATANVPAADPWESANLCAACLRAYLTAIEPPADMPGAVRVGDGARLSRGDGYEVVDTRPTDIAWEVSDDDRPMTTISFAGMPEIRLSDADARSLARSIFDGTPDAVRGVAKPDVAETFVADDKGRVHFLADVDGELLSECFFVDVSEGVTHLALFESGDLHDGLGPLADYLAHFADGVYTSAEAFKRGDRRAFDEVLAAACAAVGVTREMVEADDAAAESEAE